MQNQSIQNQCEVAYHYYTVYSNGVTGLLGFLANLVCVVVLASPSLLNTKRSGNMFKYLLMKGIMDGLVLTGRALAPFINCQTCFSFSASYWARVLFIWKEFYFKLTFLLCSMLFELMANLDRYLMMTKRLERFHTSKTCFKVICVGIVIFSHLCYIFNFFVFEIKPKDISGNNSTATSVEFYLAKTSLALSPLNQYYALAQSVFRDIVCVVLLIVLNILIIKSMRKLLHRKKAIAGHSNVANHQSEHNRTNRAQINLTRLILVTSLVTLFTRFPVILKYVPVATLNSDSCLRIAVESLYELSISINLFVYIQFNRRFRKRFQFLIFETLGKVGLKTKRLTYLHTVYSKSG